MKEAEFLRRMDSIGEHIGALREHILVLVSSGYERKMLTGRLFRFWSEITARAHSEYWGLRCVCRSDLEWRGGVDE